jgi:GTP cyclohydrolase I
VINTDKVASAVADLLLALNVDEGDHTRETPRRVADAWVESIAGYEEDPSGHLAQRFSAPCDPGLVMVTGIRLVSTCAHHLLPITGTAAVGYRPRPGDPVVGLSKLARVVYGYARRLQVQERIGYQVVTALEEKLNPLGAGCIITAAHGCMSVRGINEPCTVTTTQALGGDWQPGHPDVLALLAEHSSNLH